MYKDLILYYADYFTNEKTVDKYLLLRSSVCLSVLGGLYRMFIKDSSVVEIEKLGEEKIKLLWQHVIKHQFEKEKRILALKSAYVLNLITSTE